METDVKVCTSDALRDDEVGDWVSVERTIPVDVGVDEQESNTAEMWRLCDDGRIEMY